MEPRRLPRYKYSSICATCYKSGRMVGAEMLEFLHFAVGVRVFDGKARRRLLPKDLSGAS
jgi:hypothetical protein